MRSLLKAILPKGVHRLLRRLVPYRAPLPESSAIGDLDRAQLIANASTAELLDQGFLERHLIPRLGLNDEHPVEFPEELEEWCGEGLRIWQYPNQLAPYLIKLASLGIRSYLEVGVRHGGTFVTTVEYLSRFQPVERAVGVDMCESGTLEIFRRRRASVVFHVMDSHSPAFVDLVRSSDFDAALIDGDHSENGCWQDFRSVHGIIPVIAFHDISSDSCPAVGYVWKKVRRRYPDYYDFCEFTDQYPSVRDRTGKQFLGIGLAIAKRRSQI